MRHSIIFAHNAVVLALLLLWAGPVWSLNTLLVVPGLVMFAAAVLMAAIPVAILCTRFRDLPLIVTNVLQVIFFATPIMWRPEVLMNFRWVADYNPLAHLIDIVRLPLLGLAPGVESWLWSLGVLAVSLTLGAWLLGRYGHRVAYWL